MGMDFNKRYVNYDKSQKEEEKKEAEKADNKKLLTKQTKWCNT